MLTLVIVAGLSIFIGGVFAIVEHFEVPEPEQKIQIESNLPEGCTFHNLGPYLDLSLVVVVACDGRSTTTTTTIDPGKHPKRSASVIIE